jgi:hypothetical protein
MFSRSSFIFIPHASLCSQLKIMEMETYTMLNEGKGLAILGLKDIKSHNDCIRDDASVEDSLGVTPFKVERKGEKREREKASEGRP